MASLSNSSDLKPDGLITRAVDWVFGYDFFISYNHGDGMRLPRRLRERLEQAGFRVFLDQTEYVAGEDLRRETRRQVVKSRKIVIVGRPGALKSVWVKREVDVALAYGKIPVILNLNGAVDAAPADAALAAMARERHWLRLEETLADPDGEPTDRIIAELVRGFNHTRQETKRQRIFAGAAAVLALTAGIATWQAVEAVIARNVAEAQRDRAQRALDQIVGTANRRVESVSLRMERAKETQREARPSGQPAPAAQTDAPRSPLARANDLIGRGGALLARDDGRGARAALQEATRILDSASADESAEPQWQLARFNLYKGLAAAAFDGDDAPAALAALDKGLALATDRAAADPEASEWQERRADLHQGIGKLQLSQRNLAAAEQQYRAAAAIWRELAGAPAPQPRAQRRLAAVLVRLAEVELRQRKTDAALALYGESVSLLEGLDAAASEGDLQRELSRTYQQFTDALRAAGRPAEALLFTDKDLAIAQKSAADRAGPDQQHELATRFGRRAQVLEALGRDAEAVDSLSQGAALLAAAIATDRSDPSWLRDDAAMSESKGKLLVKLGQPERARELFRRALSLREGIAESDPEWQKEVEEAYRRFSQLLRAMQRDEEGLETAQQYLLATSLVADIDDARAERIGRALGTLCWAALMTRDFSRAVWAGRHATILAPKLDPRLDWIRHNYAHALMMSGEPAKAREIYFGFTPLSHDAAQEWKRGVLKDFEDMRKRRIEHELMREVAARFAADGGIK